MSEARAAALRQQAEEMLAEAAAIERKAAEEQRPKMPEVPENVPIFLAFSRYMGGREYNYAAVGWRVGRSVRWVITGAGARVITGAGAMLRRNWPSLLAFVGEANWSTIRVMIPGEPLIEPEDEPPVAEQMGRYGRVLSTEGSY